MARNHTWIPFPVYVFKHETGEEFVLPTDFDMRLLEEKVIEIQDKVAKAPKKEASYLKIQLAANIAVFQDKKAIIEDYKAKAELCVFEIRKPTFGEFLKVEEDSRELTAGGMSVNNKTQNEQLLLGRVRAVKLIGEPGPTQRRETEDLTLEAITDLDPDIGMKLYNRVYALTYPDPARIPFLQRHLTISPEA